MKRSTLLPIFHAFVEDMKCFWWSFHLSRDSACLEEVGPSGGLPDRRSQSMCICGSPASLREEGASLLTSRQYARHIVCLDSLAGQSMLAPECAYGWSRCNLLACLQSRKPAWIIVLGNVVKLWSFAEHLWQCIWRKYLFCSRTCMPTEVELQEVELKRGCKDAGPLDLSISI